MRIAGLIVCCEILYRTDNQTFYIFKCRRCVNARDLHVTVAVKREMRLEHFLRSAGGDIYVLSHCAADVFQHHHSFIALVFLEVGIEYFCETETKLLSFLQSLEGDTRYAGEILSHVVDIHAWASLCHALSR